MGGSQALSGALVVLVLLLALSGGSTGASVQEAPTLAVSSTQIEAGATTTVTVTLSHLPTGLAGFELTLRLSDPAVATITNVTVAPAFSLQSTTITADGASATASGVDIENTTTPGTDEITLATVTLAGTQTGTTELSLDALQIDADDGSRITPALQSGTLTVTGPTTQATTTHTTTQSTTLESTQTTPTPATTPHTTATTLTPTATATSTSTASTPPTRMASTAPGQPNQTTTGNTTPVKGTTGTTPATTPLGILPALVAVLGTVVWSRLRRAT